jgi:hypothetical protein
VILLTLSTAQAKHIAEKIEDPALLDAICQQLRFEEIFVDVDDHEPLMVMFKNNGQGLCVAAVTYYDAKAAEAAEDRFWARVLDDAQRLPLFSESA